MSNVETQSKEVLFINQLCEDIRSSPDIAFEVAPAGMPYCSIGRERNEPIGTVRIYIAMCFPKVEQIIINGAGYDSQWPDWIWDEVSKAALRRAKEEMTDRQAANLKNMMPNTMSVSN